MQYTRHQETIVPFQLLCMNMSIIKWLQHYIVTSLMTMTSLATYLPAGRHGDSSSCRHHATRYPATVSQRAPVVVDAAYDVDVDKPRLLSRQQQNSNMNC